MKRSASAPDFGGGGASHSTIRLAGGRRAGGISVTGVGGGPDAQAVSVEATTVNNRMCFDIFTHLVLHAAEHGGGRAVGGRMPCRETEIFCCLLGRARGHGAHGVDELLQCSGFFRRALRLGGSVRVARADVLTGVVRAADGEHGRQQQPAGTRPSEREQRGNHCPSPSALCGLRITSVCVVMTRSTALMTGNTTAIPRKKFTCMCGCNSPLVASSATSAAARALTRSVRERYHGFTAPSPGCGPTSAPYRCATKPPRRSRGRSSSTRGARSRRCR